MLPDRVSNPGSLTYESGALPIALRGPAGVIYYIFFDLRIYSLACTYFHSGKSIYSLQRPLNMSHIDL